MGSISKAPNYLFKQGSIFYFRLAVPLSLREMVSARELRLSLKTGYLKEARSKARVLAASASACFNRLSGALNMPITPQQVKKIIYEKVRTDLELWERKHAVGPVKTAEAVEVERQSHQYKVECLKQVIATSDYYSLWEDVNTEMRTRQIDILEDGDSGKQFCQEYAVGRKYFHEQVLKKLQGEFDYPPQLGALRATESEAKKSTKISTIIAEYCHEKKISGAWSERTAQQQPVKLNLLIETLGDVDCSSINAERIRHFKQILTKLPPNRNKSKKYKSMTLAEIVESNPPKTIEIKTVNEILGEVSALLEYATRHGYIKENYAKGVKIRQAKGKSKIKPYSNDDLIKIFTSDNIFKHKSSSPFKYWLPILALFTGARLEELSQLDLSDIVVIEGVHCIKVEDSEDKSVKTESSKRTIPIHSYLIDRLDFLTFVDSQRAAGKAKLFDGLKKIGGRYGHYASKWFSVLKQSLGFNDSYNFHSFRHTFINTLKQKGANLLHIKELVGHEGNDITTDVYGEPLSPRVTKSTVEMLEFDLGIPVTASS